MDLDSEKIFSWMFEPGVTHTMTGKRKGGKTHHLVNIIQVCEERGYHVLTNIIFKQKVGPHTFIEKSPSGLIHKVTDIQQMYEISARILDKDRDVPILVVFDEVAQSAHAYRSMGGTSFMLSQVQGDARKWNFITMFATPIYWAIPKMIRRYSEFDWFKSERLSQHYKNKYLQCKDMDIKRGMVFVNSNDLDGGPLPIVVPVGKYNKQWDDMKIGEYVYDHKASATIGEGPEWFDLNEFREIYGNTISENIPGVSLNHFEMMKAENPSGHVKHDINSVDVAKWIYATTGTTVKGQVVGQKGLKDIVVNPYFLERLTGGARSTIDMAIKDMDPDGFNRGDGPKKVEKKDDGGDENE